jgi:hypothetical protein
LNIYQVGDINDVLDLGEVFAQEVVIGDRISHSFSFGEYHKDVRP